MHCIVKLFENQSESERSFKSIKGARIALASSIPIFEGVVLG